MKIELYMSLAANGLMLAADPSHPTPDVVMMDFVARAKEARSLILGRVTYEMALRLGAGAAFSDVEIVVLSRGGPELAGARVVTTPAAALAHLDGRGHARALLGGGAAVYGAFLAESLVDDLTVNILPTVTNNGIAIGGGAAPRELELVSSRQLAGGVTQLRFRR